MVAFKDFVMSGKGLYTLKEASLYARMHPTTLSRWLKGNTSGERVFSTEEEDAKIINFLEFVQALAVRNLRVHYKISLPLIREAVERAASDHNVSYPFARPHTTYLFDKVIWIWPKGKEPLELSGKGHGQQGMTPVIEHFLKDLFYDDTGLATKYKAYHRNNISIMMDPKIRFGEPLLENCGYTPEALFEAAKTEGSAEAAAKIYGVSKEQVEVCIEYFDYLQAA